MDWLTWLVNIVTSFFTRWLFSKWKRGTTDYHLKYTTGKKSLEVSGKYPANVQNVSITNAGISFTSVASTAGVAVPPDVYMEIEKSIEPETDIKSGFERRFKS